MSRLTKKKHVMLERLNSEIRLPNENETLGLITSSPGNNLHMIETAVGDSFLVTMPCKFRKTIWVKRGDFVLFENIPEGGKVKGEVVHVLTKEHIKYYKAEGLWPERFEKKNSENGVESVSDAVKSPETDNSDASSCSSDSENDGD